MAELRDLVAEYVDSAKINWAHICIALLFQAGYVDRVLTTNFDPLVNRACALLGQFPAVYDCAPCRGLLSHVFENIDVIVCPTMTTPPFPITQKEMYSANFCKTLTIGAEFLGETRLGRQTNKP